VRGRQFDHGTFYASIDGERRARGLTWKRVAEEAGVSASSLSRISRGHRPDVDTLAALTVWGGLDANAFIEGRSSPSEGRLAPSTIAAYLRRDPQLSNEAAATLTNILAVSYARLADRTRRNGRKRS
jgi:transcriptional regulator with XRE-family HTH domain